MIAKLLGLSIPAWVYEAVIVLALAGSAVLYLEHRGAEGEIVKLQKTSNELIKSADNQIASINARHADEVQANQEKLNAALAANTAMQSQLDQRVRDFDAYRRAHAPVARAPSQPTSAASGECGARSCGDLAAELAVRGDELAGSLGELSASLQACQRDRDALTGLPQ